MAATDLQTAERNLRSAAQALGWIRTNALLTSMGMYPGTSSTLSANRGRVQARTASAAHIAGSSRSRTKTSTGAARQQTGKVERWIADKSAKRVPTFAQGMTGLSSSVAIRKKYGEGAVFEVGKPCPAPIAGT